MFLLQAIMNILNLVVSAIQIIVVFIIVHFLEWLTRF